MQILSTRNINPNSQYSTVQHPQFKGVTAKADKIGMLGRESSYMIQDFLHRYDEIKKILERKTEEGLRKIALYYPEITLGENIVFHNCGEEKNSISIRIAESEKYRGLAYIARRKGNTESTRKIILDSFMLDGRERLISNYKPNYSKFFPKEREYISQEMLEKQNLEENLQNLLRDLDPAMLKFRKFLAKNSDSDIKLPDGKIDYKAIENIKEAFRICSEIEKQTEQISNKRVLAMNSEFKDYSAISGLKSYMFKNLGEEKVSIKLSEIENKQGYNLKRLYIYDENNKPIRTFMIVDNEKFVTNLNQNLPNDIPRTFTFANSEELEKDYLPEFEKYFKLYTDKLKEYQRHVNKTVNGLLKQEISGEFDLNTSSILSEALDWYNVAKIKLRKLPPLVSNSIRSKVQQLEPAVGKTGLWLKDDDRKKIIQFLPLNSRDHKNLIRISITDMNTSQKKDYLIHDFKHIVENYNPQYPTIIPKILKYASEKEIEESGLEIEFRYIRKKSEELAIKSDSAFEKREELLKERKEKERTKKIKTKQAEKLKEYRELTKSCKQQFDEALKNLDKGIENFNTTIDEIKRKLNDFYNSQKNPSSV